MQLQLVNFTTAVQRFAASARAASSVALNFTTGSVMLALAEANAAVVLWLQWLIIKVLSATRLATSTGGDADTFVNDFGMARLAAVASSGQVTFARFAPGVAAFIPVGTTVRTADGTQSFAIGTDTTNAAWNATALGYNIAAGAASVTVLANAVTAGAAGNVAAATITQITSAIPYVDTASNSAPFVSGLDAETDTAMKTRFMLFVNSRTRATPQAVAYAIASYQQGLSYAILENIAPDSTYRPGFFTVVLDDGSGAPPSTLISAVYLAIDAVRPLGGSFAVVAPGVVTAAISLSISAAPGYVHATLQGPVANAILTYIDTLTIGQPLAYTKVAQAAYSVPGVGEVDNVLLNGATANLIPTSTQVVRATLSNIAVS